MKYGSGSAADFGEAHIASIMINDLALTEVLNCKALRSIQGAGGEGDWALGTFRYYTAPVPGTNPSQVFNYLQQITNNTTYIGEMVNQNITLDITNSGANSTNNAVLLTSLNNSKS